MYININYIIYDAFRFPKLKEKKQQAIKINDAKKIPISLIKKKIEISLSNK